MTCELTVHLARLPVPNPQLAVSVATHDIVAIGRDARLARVSRDHVSLESLLSIELEAVTRRVRGDLVVEVRAQKPLVVWRLGHSGHRVHRRIRYVLDRHRDAILPHKHLLVIRRRDEAPILLAEGERVHGTKVLIVHLLDLTRTHIILDDLLVRAAREQCVLLVGMQLRAEGQLAVGKRGDALAGLCVPQLQVSVIRARHEASAVIGEVDIAHGSRVAAVRAHALLRIVHVPNLHFRVHACRQQHVRRIWEPSNRCDALSMAREGVDEALGDEALVLVVGLLVCRRVQPRAPLIVGQAAAVEGGRLRHRLWILRLSLALTLALRLLVARGDGCRLLGRELRLSGWDWCVALV
mmetsp:Transcript_1482/g.4191  ORF Transcript_1482/g.4191 Transcript_1482/m.4191 type:complete len:353 (+) Transcript_1482:403-1461(+)